MDQERERIQADLRGVLRGEVRCDDLFLQMYASDASIYEVRPLAIVRPRGAQDVAACIQYAVENRIPIHARGAGTGLAGESLGPGIVLDFSHSMRRILEVGEETVRVHPGVILSQLNSELAKHGRMFAPDPSTRSVTTIGSVIALDANGSHYPQYGSAKDHVESLQVVLADGSVADFGKHSLNPRRIMSKTPRRDDLVTQLAELLHRNAALIKQYIPQSVNRSGYNVFDIVDGDQIDLARLMVGSEGTLSLTVEATLRTVPLPEHRGVALLFFDRLENAAKGAIELQSMNVAACDLMDRRLLSIARESDVRFELLIPKEAEAMLLVEIQADDPNVLREQLKQLVYRLQRRRKLAFDARTTLERDERDLYWRLTRRVISTLYKLEGSSRPLPFVEGITIPPRSLPEFLVTVQNILKSHETMATVFAHAGHGQLHIRPFLDLANPSDVRKMQALATDIYEEVLEFKGSVSGEHGDGLSRTWFVPKQFGPLYEVFREVKRIFDPENILNPGKIVADSPQPMTKNLRPVTAVTSEETETKSERLQLQLVWDNEELAYAARSCNGCGRCRTHSPEERMCPIFRFSPREEATPRAKANLMRAIVTGRLESTALEADDLKQISDLCVNCHQCKIECPAGVDIPKLMIECKAQYVATNGLTLSDWILSRLDLFSALGSLLHPVANWAIGNRTMRWLLEKITGIAQGRKLPRFARRSFQRLAHRKRLTRPTRRSGRKVLYFVDVYANWHDVQLADALVAVMEHNGVAVYVHPEQQQSGMPMISMGAVERARYFASRNVSILADAVRQGYQIVTTEPATTACLRIEYPNILQDDDVHLVAENTLDAGEYLWQLHQAGQLELDLRPINATVGYHLPCHVRTAGRGAPGANLLRLIPGLVVHTLEKGCSGMAGTFGLKRENYRSSLRAGWGVISAVRDSSLQVASTECSACKLQMEQGTPKPTIHPLKFLALSYGVMPELDSLLSKRNEDLIVS
ncbi:MAG: anaerobic glycerol-3-phosphate dehydrogenase C subunit [Pirellulaceae bacterium]|jgi:anaerobic glycerol-3-phosphate dehydrogenase C subunit